jgi:hypothetical protein
MDAIYRIALDLHLLSVVILSQLGEMFVYTILPPHKLLNKLGTDIDKLLS